MKTGFNKMFVLVALMSFACAHPVLAQRWLGTVSDYWETAANWEGGAVPARTSSTVTFDDAGANTTIRFGGSSATKNVVFASAACPSYTLGSVNTERLWLVNYGSLTINEAVVNNQSIQGYVQLGNADTGHSIYINNNSPAADLIFLSDLRCRSTATGNVTLWLNGIGDIIFHGNLVTNGTANVQIRNYNSGTVTLNGYTHVNMLYNFNSAPAPDNTRLVLNTNAELFLNYRNTHYSIWHEGTGVIEGAGTLRFGVGLENEPARVYIKTGSQITIKTALTSAGGLEMYHSSGGGRLILDCVNTMAGDMVLNSSGGMLSVAKIGNSGATDSNLGMGSKIVLLGSNSSLIYTGEGETTDRIIDFAHNVSLDQSGSGDLIFSEDLIFSAAVARTLTLNGSTTGIGELAGAIGAANNLAALTKDGSGEWRLSGANTYTGITTLKDGTLTLSGANGAIAATASINLAGGTLRIANTADANHLDRVNDNAALTLQGGSIDFAHDSASGINYVESLGALTIGDNISEVRISSAAAGSSSTLTFASVTVNGNGSVNFTGDALGEEGGSITNRIFFNTPPVLVDGVIPWAIVNGTAMATYDLNRGLYASSVNIAARGPNSIIPDDATANVEITADGIEGAITLESSGGASVATLTQNSATPAVIAMNNQTLEAYRVMINENAASLTLGASVTEGGALHIASGNAGMGLVNHSTNTLTVNSEIYESFPGTGIAKSGPGPVTINGKVGVVGDMLVTDGCLTLGALANEKHLIGSYFEMRGGAQTPTELKLHGSAEVANNGNLYAGINPGDRCVLTITNDLTIQALTKEEGGRFYVGSGVNTAGAVIQNSGDLIVSINLSGTAFYILGGHGGYGYHRLNNGSLATGEMTIGASSSSGDGNSSVVDIFGGELKIEGWCILVSWGKGAGALNVFNGAVNCPGTLGSEAFLLTYNNGVGSTAQVNLLGPNAKVFADGPYEKKRINMARGANNALSALNLNDGELALHQAFVTSDTTPSHFNFNGGLLKAANNSMMMSGLTAAHVFNGNARIDTDGYNAAINQPLVVPHGYGAVSIELLSGGSGYIGAPAVVIEGGSGIGATAIALVDLESDSITCGQVTNIMVTGSGVGYAETDTLNAVLRGGGCLTPATAGAVSLAPNVSGALIKLGAGTLTLNGACTYTGGTLVSEGTLKLGCADALPPSGTVTLAEGTILDLNGFTATNAVAGAGTFINGALYGEFSPAGTGVIGAQTLTPGANAALSGAYILDVEESGTCDQLVISGDINLSALQLQVVDPAKLNRRKSYPIAAVSGQVTGVFAPGNLPNEKWLIKNTQGTLWLFYSDGLQLIIR